MFSAISFRWRPRLRGTLRDALREGFVLRPATGRVALAGKGRDAFQGIQGLRLSFRDGSVGSGLEWFLLVVAAAGSTIFGRFEEKTPPGRRLSKWAVYLGLTALVSRKPGRSWSLVWIASPPVAGLAFYVGWCGKHGAIPIAAEPKDRDYKFRSWKED